LTKVLIQKQNNSLHITINIANSIHAIHRVPIHINLVCVKKFLNHLMIILIHHCLILLNLQLHLKLLHILKKVLLILFEIFFLLLNFFNLSLGSLPLRIILQKCSCSTLLLWKNWQEYLTYNWSLCIVRELWQTQVSLIQ